MFKSNIENLRIASISDVAFPVQIMSEIPASEKAKEVVTTTRSQVHDVLNDRDDRLITIVGPCSIHDPEAAMEYAGRMASTIPKLSQDLLIVMRVYFEKPRTTIGWKGLMNDPDLNGSFDINKGLKLARQLLLSINELGLPAGVEFFGHHYSAIHCRSRELGSDWRSHYRKSGSSATSIWAFLCGWDEERY